MADDLDENYVIEQIGDDETESTKISGNDLVDNVALEQDTPKKPSRTKNAKTLPRKQKVKGISPEDLGIDVEVLPELHEQSFVSLLDKLYENQAKPLVVKSHTKIKVLIVCSSALRCLEIIRELKSIPNLRVAKLFAKHMKMNDQIEALKSIPFLIGVGTANRIVKILETDPDALKPKRIEYVIIDGSHQDKKSMTIWNLNEHHPDLKQLYELVKEYTLGVYNF